MRPIALLLVGLAIGWVVASIEWTPDALAQENILRTPDARDQIIPPRPADPLMPEASLPKRNLDLLNAPRNSAQEPAEQSRKAEAARKLVEGVQSAAATPAPPSGRFQISAYGTPHGHGCYAIDTATGATWHIGNDQPPEQLTDRLPPLITKYAPHSETPPFSVPTPHIEPAPMPSVTPPAYPATETPVPLAPRAE